MKRRAELKVLNFNNALLKAVRAARPLIADKLWNLVLSAVSRYFSEMRGTKSRVTKDSDGFKADGHTATTLSGSTLDILGLAIRVALTRTFLPTAPFLVLDEPAVVYDGGWPGLDLHRQPTVRVRLALYRARRPVRHVDTGRGGHRQAVRRGREDRP